jgi:hypothetical protein
MTDPTVPEPIDAAGLREKMIEFGYRELAPMAAPHGMARFRILAPDQGPVFLGDTPSEAWAQAVQHFTAPSYSSLAAEVVRLREELLTETARADAAEAEISRLKQASVHDDVMLGETIGQREAAEEAISQAYFLMIGRSPEWSNKFGFTDALEDIEDAQSSLRQALASTTTRLHALSEAAAMALAALGPFARIGQLVGEFEATYDKKADGPYADDFRAARTAYQTLASALSDQSKEERT